MYTLITLVHRDGEWLCFHPLLNTLYEHVGSMCVWGETVYTNVSHPDADSLEPGMTVAVPAEDYTSVQIVDLVGVLDA